MSRRPCLSDVEKTSIVSKLADGLTIKTIAAQLDRDPRTIKKYCTDPLKKVPRKDKGKRRAMTRRDLSKVSRELRKNPTSTSNLIFKSAGIENVSKSVRCRILRNIASHVSPIIRPPLTEIHKKSRLQWAERYLKCDFNTVMFTDEMRATLDGPDGWSKTWVPRGSSRPQRMRRQQGGGGVMMWAGIIGNEILGPFRIADGVKINSVNYITFLKEKFVPWYKRKTPALKRKIIFMHDNAPSHSAKATR